MIDCGDNHTNQIQDGAAGVVILQLNKLQVK